MDDVELKNKLRFEIKSGNTIDVIRREGELGWKIGQIKVFTTGCLFEAESEMFATSEEQCAIQNEIKRLDEKMKSFSEIGFWRKSGSVEVRRLNDPKWVIGHIVYNSSNPCRFKPKKGEDIFKEELVAVEDEMGRIDKSRVTTKMPVALQTHLSREKIQEHKQLKYEREKAAGMAYCDKHPEFPNTPTNIKKVQTVFDITKAEITVENIERAVKWLEAQDDLEQS